MLLKALEAVGDAVIRQRMAFAYFPSLRRVTARVLNVSRWKKSSLKFGPLFDHMQIFRFNITFRD